MSTQKIANEFTDALKAGEFKKCEAMWSNDIVSLENMDGPMARLEGRKAVEGKGEWWFANHEIHSFEAQGPFVNGDAFAVAMQLDVTNKESGERTQMNEVGLYTVKGGKIVEERFFW